MLEIPKDFVPKKFWNRPEGTTGMIFIGLGIAAGVLSLSVILPIIYSILASAVMTVAMGLVLAFMLYMILNGKVRTLASYIFKSSMRAICGVFVTIDPIGILKNYVASLEKKALKLDDQITGLKGQMRKLKTTIDSNERERINCLKLMQQAQKNDNQRALELNGIHASELQESNKTLLSMYNTLEEFCRIMIGMYEESEVMIERLNNTVSVKSTERKALKDASGMIKTIRALFKGNPDERELFDQALEYLADDAGMKMGEIDDFMTDSKKFMEKIDLQKGVYSSDAQEMLKAWQEKSNSLLSDNQKQTLLAEARDPNNVLDLDPQSHKKSSGRYESLLKGNSGNNG